MILQQMFAHVRITALRTGKWSSQAALISVRSSDMQISRILDVVRFTTLRTRVWFGRLKIRKLVTFSSRKKRLKDFLKKIIGNELAF